ncbi:MAG: hypothetical protein LAO24_03185 [Acidobacteriia bacterium]|nr:hypothetical protein [Terriglobia bacterium]
MQRLLNQEEIDALVKAARAGGRLDLPPADQPRIETWDARRAGVIGREQLHAITVLHEAFARNLTHALGAYLRVAFAATLVSAENLTYREFLQRVPETTYLASCRLEPMGMSGLLQLDLKVAFPVVDVLLGGEGKGTIAARQITQIEEQILESVARIVFRELGAAWQALSLVVSFDERLEEGAANRLMPPEEKSFCLSFEINMSDVRGGLNLAVPAAVSNALLRKISADWSYRRPRGQADSRQRLVRRLLDCPFRVELGATGLNSAIGKLTDLAPGKLLSFSRSSAKPASLLVAGLEIFRAIPARCRNLRAAKVLESRLESAEAQIKENPTL